MLTKVGYLVKSKLNIILALIIEILLTSNLSKDA